MIEIPETYILAAQIKETLIGKTILFTSWVFVVL